MAEEIKVAGTAQAPAGSTTDPTLIEQKAMESGWVPQDQWDGDENQWRPAKEFLDRGELFKKIDDQNRTIKEVKRAMEDLKRHHSSVRETEYARALTSLKQQKLTALEEGDAAAVIEIDDKMDLVKDEQRKLTQTTTQEPATPEYAPEFVNWVNKNRWYETSDIMKAAADTIGRRLASAGLSPDQVLVEVEKQIRIEFPAKFTNPNRAKPGAVEGSTSKGGKGSDSYALSDDERRVMQRFVRQGVMTEDQYIKELKSVKGA